MSGTQSMMRDDQVQITDVQVLTSPAFADTKKASEVEDYETEEKKEDFLKPSVVAEVDELAWHGGAEGLEATGLC